MTSPDASPDPAQDEDARLVVEIHPTQQLAGATADRVEECAQAAVADRGRFVLAVSGGSTPGPMFSDLFARDLDWERATILQVDERLAPAGHEDRNLTDLEQRLRGTRAEAATLRPMPVEAVEAVEGVEGVEHGQRSAAADYAEQMREVAGDPPVIDVIQLGLGPDGHTASLVPGDPVLDVSDSDVALSGEYEGRRRMTLTYPAINRAECIVWMVAGEKKRAALLGMLQGEPDLPASHIRRDAIVFADPAAAGR